MNKSIAWSLTGALLGGALTFCSGAAASAPIQVRNLQPITEGMRAPVMLKVVGSGAGCTYLGQLIRRVQSDPNSQWVLKSQRRSCMKSKGGDLVISDVQALVPLDKLPVPRETELTLYQRDNSR